MTQGLPDLVLGATDALPKAIAEIPSNSETGLFPRYERVFLNPGAPAQVSPVLGISPRPMGWMPFFTGDFYYRIWVFPAIMRLANPSLNVDIPFEIWNAFIDPNTLHTINAIGDTGLTLDIVPPVSFRAVEIKTVNLRITDLAPATIEANYTFIFDTGFGLFEFQAQLFLVFDIAPDTPVSERWQWLTDILISWNNVEQRIALRDQPRRTLEIVLSALDELRLRHEFRRLSRTMNRTLIVPYFQYAARLLQTSGIGATKLYFDPARTDLRDDDHVFIYSEATETGFVVQIETVDIDGATLVGPLTDAALIGNFIVPTFASRIDAGAGLQSTAITGQLAARTVSRLPRSSFTRPGSAAIIAQHDGTDVLDRRVLATSPVAEVFDPGYRIIDGQTGISDITVRWPYPTVTMNVLEFRIDRDKQPGELDFWRDFCARRHGQRDPFFAPTWRPDLVLSEAPFIGSNKITVFDNDYAIDLFPHAPYQNLQVEAADHAVAYVRVQQITDNGDGTVTLLLSPSLPSEARFAMLDMRVSLLVLSRLAADEIMLVHSGQITHLSLAAITVSG